MRLHERGRAERLDREREADDAPKNGTGDNRPEPGHVRRHVDDLE